MDVGGWSSLCHREADVGGAVLVDVGQWRQRRVNLRVVMMALGADMAISN